MVNTVNPLTRVPLPPSGLVTTTFRGPTAAFKRLNLQVIAVAEDTVTFEALIVVFPLMVSFMVAPATKLVPLIVTDTALLPFIALLGVIEVTVGAVTGAGGIVVRTVNPFTSVPMPPSGFVTTTFPAPIGAFRRFNLQVIVVEVDTVTFKALMVLPPTASCTTVRFPAPATKPVPPIVTHTLVFPLTALLGVIEVTVGAETPYAEEWLTVMILAVASSRTAMAIKPDRTAKRFILDES